MFINIPAGGKATLEDADNFKTFKIVLAAPDVALGPVGRRDGGYGWVSVAWLQANGWPDDADWRAGFNAMLAYAEASGWIDESGAVRGHIELA